MGETTIAWTNTTWNPLRGCTRVSEGCRNCYAERVAARFAGPGQPYEGTVTGKGRWSGHVRLVHEHLGDPLRWTRPRMVFVNSMSDLFHESVPDEFIAAVFGVMASSSRHTFQVLTKRPERMRSWFEWIAAQARELEDIVGETPPAGRGEASACGIMASSLVTDDRMLRPAYHAAWPLPNVWLGVSVEDQAAADTRIPLLLSTPAAIRWISAEPLLGQVDLSAWVRPSWGELRPSAMGGSARPLMPPLDWVVVGGESGPGARPCNVEWIRGVVAQCRAGARPCFVKQLGACFADSVNGVAGPQACVPPEYGRPVTRLEHPKGGDPAEWAADLRVREYPAVTP